MSWVNSATYGNKASVNLSVYDCLNYFVGDQIIEKNCERCQQVAPHNAKIKFNSLPDYLILSFKRFKYNYWSSKVSDQVYLTKSLEMKIIDDGIEEDSEYELTAVIEHYGFVFRGHYKIYLNNQGEWWLLDDKTIKKIDFSTVFNSQAYIALYTRRRHSNQFCQNKFSSPNPNPDPMQEISPKKHETTNPDLKLEKTPEEEMKLQ
jgi:ubiquitin C-terminal hydrolase